MAEYVGRACCPVHEHVETSDSGIEVYPLFFDVFWLVPSANDFLPMLLCFSFGHFTSFSFSLVLD